MPEHESHHFVPQFYLRNFGCGGAISVYNIRRAKFIERASIRGQCQKKFLYGRDNRLEEAFARFEGQVARVIAEIVNTTSLPRIDSKDYFRLLHFVIFQWRRTLSAGEELDALLTKFSRALLRATGSVPEHMRGEIDDLQVKHKDPVMFALATSNRTAHLLLDLVPKVIVNRSHIEFITSDSPIVLYNQWAQGARHAGTTGLCSSGLQVFLPVSPRRCLLLYDNDIYRVGEHLGGAMAVSDRRHIRNINALQLASVHENFYFSGDSNTREGIRDLPTSPAKSELDLVHVKRGVEVDGTSQLLHTFREIPNLAFGIPQIRVHKKAQKTPLEERAHRYRQSALEADALLGEDRRRDEGAPDKPMSWRIVDDEDPQQGHGTIPRGDRT